MQNLDQTPVDLAAFQTSYLAELNSRVQRSEAVGAITLKKGSAALFFEPNEAKFTLVEKMTDRQVATVFDCVPREQWGRTVMLFGHATNVGGYTPRGHATLEGNCLKIKLSSGRYYRIDVDGTIAHLQPYACQPSKAKQESAGHVQRAPVRPKKTQTNQIAKPLPPNTSQTEQVGKHTAVNDECEDLTEEDLRRLRGDMPLATKPRRKWNH